MMRNSASGGSRLLSQTSRDRSEADFEALSADQRAEKLEKMKKEVEVLKVKISQSRKALQDTTLAKRAESIPPLGRLVFKVRRNMKGHLAKIYSIAWAPDGRHVASASQDSTLIVWDAYAATRKHLIPLASSWVMTCAYSPSGSFVASGGLDNACSIYNVSSATSGVVKPRQELTGHSGYISCCQFLYDRQVGASGLACHGPLISVDHLLLSPPARAPCMSPFVSVDFDVLWRQDVHLMGCGDWQGSETVRRAHGRRHELVAFEGPQHLCIWRMRCLGKSLGRANRQGFPNLSRT